MTPSLEELQAKLGYSFKDVSLLQLALTHRSKSANNNERLEFLGDAILGFVVADLLYAELDQASEGQLSRSRAALVKKETLARLAKNISLGDYLLLGPGELKSGGFRRSSILADSLEAIFGATYLDGGIEAATRLIASCIQPLIKELPDETDLKDPKTRLQEYLQARQLPLPEYTVISTEGDEHKQQFVVQCNVSILEQPTTGTGKSRRRAEQSSAQAALDLLQ